MATSTIVTSSVAKVTKPNMTESLMLMHELPPDDPEVVARLPLQGPNQWPDWMPDFQPRHRDTYDPSSAVARRYMVRMIATSLDLPETFLDHFFEHPTTFLRLLALSAAAADRRPTTSSARRRTPTTASSRVLAQDYSGGLQVKPRGRDWIDAPPIPEHLRPQRRATCWRAGPTIASCRRRTA